MKSPNQIAIEALNDAAKAALHNHGRVLTSHPPKDAWTHHRVAEKLTAAIAAAEALPPPAQGSTLPERDQTKPAEQQGLFRKFDVRRVDGSSESGGKHYGCRYFVLDMDHDQHAPAAMRAYATGCRDTHPTLSAELVREFGSPAQGSIDVATWRSRCDGYEGDSERIVMADAEIAALRSALADRAARQSAAPTVQGGVEKLLEFISAPGSVYQEYAPALRAALTQRAAVADVASLTPEQVIELLKYELIIDSGARFLLNGDSMSFSLEELTLFANHVRGTTPTASTPPAPERSEKPAEKGETKLPDGWVALNLSFDGDDEHSEEIAYGPKVMMERLGKKIDKFYVYRIAERDAAPTPSSDRSDGTAVGWHDALAEVRATVSEMQNNLEAFGEYSQETARCVLDGVLDSIDELIAQPYEAAALDGYALVPLRVTKEMREAWDGTPDNEDNDVLFAHAYSRMIAASTKAPIPRWDQLVNWYGDQPAITLMVEGMKAENIALRAALTMKDSHAS